MGEAVSSDSWERWREDLRLSPSAYCRKYLGMEFATGEGAFGPWSLDLMYRAKSLAWVDMQRTRKGCRDVAR